jgi:uncharacterized membrane protein
LLGAVTELGKALASAAAFVSVSGSLLVFTCGGFFLLLPLFFFACSSQLSQQGIRQYSKAQQVHASP